MTVDAFPHQHAHHGEHARSRKVSRASLTAMAINAVLALIQIVVGLFAGAFSLIADAFHTMADLATDGMVAWASRRAGAPPDADHPYGHGRLETLASFALGLVLIGVGAGFVLVAANKLQHPEALTTVAWPALGVAGVVLLSKEGLYHWLRWRGRTLDAPVLLAAAWHARSDALSSLVVAIGVGGSLLGITTLEPIAAAIVGALIVAMGARFAWRAIAEFIDTGLPPAQVHRIETLIRQVPGVEDVHQLRTRRMGHQVLVDAHVQVAPRLSVSEGHRISDAVMHALRTAIPEIADITLHVDHEPDLGAPQTLLPGRDALLPALRDALRCPSLAHEHLILHYHDSRISIDLLCLDPARCPSRRPLAQALELLQPAFPQVRALRLFHLDEEAQLPAVAAQTAECDASRNHKTTDEIAGMSPTASGGNLSES